MTTPKTFKFATGGTSSVVLSRGFIEQEGPLSEPTNPGLEYRQRQRWLIWQYPDREQQFSIAEDTAGRGHWDTKASWIAKVKQEWAGTARPTFAAGQADIYKYAKAPNGKLLPDYLPTPQFPPFDIGANAWDSSPPEGAPLPPDPVSQHGPFYQLDIGFYKPVDSSKHVYVWANRFPETNLYLEYWAAAEVSELTGSPLLEYHEDVGFAGFRDAVNGYAWPEDKVYLAIVACFTYQGGRAPQRDPWSTPAES